MAKRGREECQLIYFHNEYCTAWEVYRVPETGRPWRTSKLGDALDRILKLTGDMPGHGRVACTGPSGYLWAVLQTKGSQ